MGLKCLSASLCWPDTRCTDVIPTTPGRGIAKDEASSCALTTRALTSPVSLNFRRNATCMCVSWRAREHWRWDWVKAGLEMVGGGSDEGILWSNFRI